LVLRSERLWGDYSRLDSFLGGSGVRPLDIHIRTFKTKIAPLMHVALVRCAGFCVARSITIRFCSWNPRI
jgi:hypothetical protein